MGTSVNQPSPPTDNWRLVQDIYTDPTIGVEAALGQIWRAASNPTEMNLAALIADPVIGSFARLAESASSPAQAYDEATRFVSDNKVASLASDLATRAVLQCAGRPDAPAHYRERLFAEATNYLVSRDLPGYVSPGSKLANVADARRFVQDITSAATAAVRNTPPPATADRAEWPRYVARVIRAMRGRR
jgi:hypothetical protein